MSWVNGGRWPFVASHLSRSAPSDVAHLLQLSRSTVVWVLPWLDDSYDLGMSSPLSDALAVLFGDAPTSERGLPVELPAGRVIWGEEGAVRQPALWLSDAPAAPGMWGRLLAAHRNSGLWPLLLAGLHLDEARPWAEGELWTGRMSSPAGHDPASLLAKWWSTYTRTGGERDPVSPATRLAITAPYGRQWPGLAAEPGHTDDPDAAAGRIAEELLSGRPSMRLGLVAADRGADALAVAGWTGPMNYTNDTGEVCAVVRSWEERFGVRVVAAGFAEMWLSVAAPPADLDEAVAVAAEHFAFCPDNIWQGHPHSLIGYAETLVATSVWQFWWD